MVTSMFFVKRWMTVAKIVGVAFLLSALTATLIYHREGGSSPSVIIRNDVMQKIINSMNNKEKDPGEYLRKEVEDEYLKSLWKEIARADDVVEKLEFELGTKHPELILKYISEKVLTSVKGVPSEIFSGSKSAEKIHDAIKQKFDRRAYFDTVLEKVIMRNKPQSPSIKKGSDIGGHGLNNVYRPKFSKNFLNDNRLRITDEQFGDLQLNHDNVVRTIRDMPEPPKEFVNGNGIVINGGGDYLLGALTVIGNIRELGSVLPIELVLSYHNEYDTYICDTLLPRLNTKCIVVEDLIGAPLLKKIDLKRFQLKVLGLFVSSFDNIIALDADNFLLKNPDTLFDMEVFKKTQFVLWPDIWHKGTSPKYYEIARFDIGEPVGRMGIPNDASFTDYIQEDRDQNILFHDLEGTLDAIGAETGQMVFSKRKHYKSFLLALYYNVFGYSHYYPLLFQGVYGTGDRETFAPALHVMDEPYHQVRRETWLAGFQDGANIFRETTLVQYDPQQSDDFFVYWKTWLKSKNLDTRLWPFQDNEYTKNLKKQFLAEHENYKMPEIMFLHIHRPKINAVANALPHAEAYDDLFSRRNLGLPGKYPEFGTTDWELKFHSISRWFACIGVNSKNFWRDISKVEQDKVCSAVSNYIEFLLKDTKDPDSEKLKVIPRLFEK